MYGKPDMCLDERWKKLRPLGTREEIEIERCARTYKHQSHCTGRHLHGEPRLDQWVSMPVFYGSETKSVCWIWNHQFSVLNFFEALLVEKRRLTDENHRILCWRRNSYWNSKRLLLYRVAEHSPLVSANIINERLLIATLTTSIRKTRIQSLMVSGLKHLDWFLLWVHYVLWKRTVFTETK